MATEEDWTSYRTAVVDMVPPTGEPFRITPAQPGTTGTWPEGVEPPVFVVTAWDPDSVPLDPGLNRSRHRRLVTELERLGVTWWPAVGRDARSAHAEEGVAVAGLDEERARALGRRFGQAAVYGWAPDVWEVVSCTDGRRHRSGWSTAPLPG